MSNGVSNGLTAVILTAIPVEYEAVRMHLTGVHEDVHVTGTIYERGYFSCEGGLWNVGIVEVGLGNASTAVAAERAINHFQPTLMLFVGVAGGLKDVKIGDVVAASKVYGYAYGKVETDFDPRPDFSIPTFRMEHRARAEAKKPDWFKRIQGQTPDPDLLPKAIVAPIASGDQVIASTDSVTWNLLRLHYSDAVAVEMEGHGFLRAVRAYSHIDALIIRGISDLIDGKREADANNFQEMASRYASAFAFELLAKWHVEHQQTHDSTQTPTFHQESLKKAEQEDNTSSQQQPISSLSGRPINLLLDEFLTALPEYYKKVKNIYDLFETGENISFSRSHLSMNVLNELHEHIKQLSSNASMLKLFDKVRLLDIQVQISQLLVSLQAFSNLHSAKKSLQKRTINKLREDARTKCKLLLESLKQFN